MEGIRLMHIKEKVMKMRSQDKLKNWLVEIEQTKLAIDQFEAENKLKEIEIKQNDNLISYAKKLIKNREKRIMVIQREITK